MQTKLDGITLYVDIDEMPPHPRKDCDNLGTLLGWHRHYNFSDKDDYPTPAFTTAKKRKISTSACPYICSIIRDFTFL